ncbi:MAG: DMT family transporter [Blastocatellia bacterium]|nr:DMT family transporter [Blastocatellia bacterium]
MSTTTQPEPPPVRSPMPGVYAALLTVQLFFGINYYATKVILAEIPPRAWAVLRIAAAALLLLGWHTLFVRTYPTRRDFGWLALFAVFGVMLNQIFFIEGLARTTPAHSAIIGTTIPVMTLLIGTVAGKERLQFLKIIGITLSLGGVWWLLGIDRIHFDAGQRWGDLLTLLNCIFFAVFLAISRETVAKYDAITSTTFLMLVGMVGLGIICGADFHRFWVDKAGQVSLKGWLHTGYVVVFPTVVNYGLNYWALKRVEASVVAVFIYIQPVVATALSVFLLGEVVTLRMVVSSLLIFGGVFLTSPILQRKS